MTSIDLRDSVIKAKISNTLINIKSIKYTFILVSNML